MAQLEDSICPVCKVPQNKLPHGYFCPLGGTEVVSLRDQFAMATISTAITLWTDLPKHLEKEALSSAGLKNGPGFIGRTCYEIADAMLEARKVKP